jgi:PAS domain S-box-containing protein
MWEGTFVRKDGWRLPVEVNTHLVDLGGSQTIISSVRDISKRKEAQKQYRDTFDGAIEGIYQASLQGQVLTVNPALATMLGYDSPHELVSTMTDTASQLWVDQNERVAVLELLKQHPVVRGYECQWKRKDGTACWVSFNGRIVFGADAQPVSTEGFIEDITERKRMQDTLRKSAETFAVAFRSGPAMALMLSPDEEGNRIIDVSEAFEHGTGYRREEVIGRTREDLEATNLQTQFVLILAYEMGNMGCQHAVVANPRHAQAFSVKVNFKRTHPFVIISRTGVI